MTHKHLYPALGIGTLLALAAMLALLAQQPAAHRKTDTQAAVSKEVESFERAEFSFAITDISKDGPNVSFTIPENARALEEQADAVVVSGLYKAGQDQPDDCPMVSSKNIEKSVEDYDPLSGKARVTAHFDDAGMADAAYEQGCLLINDP